MSTAGLLESFTARYPFPLDDFQVEAIRAVLAGKSVIVSAPTGAGKTLVAEFAIHAALHRGRRLAYTTSLKALSNQKFADFCRQFGAGHVGILTGDVKVNPGAAILVMTTEILRNMFYTGGLSALETVVLDDATTWATRAAARCGRRSSSTRRRTPSSWSCRPRWLCP